MLEQRSTVDTKVAAIPARRSTQHRAFRISDVYLEERALLLEGPASRGRNNAAHCLADIRGPVRSPPLIRADTKNSLVPPRVHAMRILRGRISRVARESHARRLIITRDLTRVREDGGKEKIKSDRDHLIVLRMITCARLLASRRDHDEILIFRKVSSLNAAGIPCSNLIVVVTVDTFVRGTSIIE